MVFLDIDMFIEIENVPTSFINKMGNARDKADPVGTGEQQYCSRSLFSYWWCHGCYLMKLQSKKCC